MSTTRRKKAAPRSSGTTFEVLVGTFGTAPVRVRVRGGATVGEVLKGAEVETSSSTRVWLNGGRATKSSRVKKGDIVTVVSPKQAG